jgi:hypothetical protein
VETQPTIPATSGRDGIHKCGIRAGAEDACVHWITALGTATRAGRDAYRSGAPPPAAAFGVEAVVGWSDAHLNSPASVDEVVQGVALAVDLILAEAH